MKFKLTLSSLLAATLAVSSLSAQEPAGQPEKTEAEKRADAAKEAENLFQYAKLVRRGYVMDAKESPAEIYAIFDKAAATGDARALAEKGICLASGYGVATDADAAFLCLFKAAEAGEAQAMRPLAQAYRNGAGTLQDNRKFVEWTVKAAEAGDKECYLPAAIAYATGKGIARNPDEAFKWHSKAAESGDAKALYYLGVCHMKGVGTAINAAKAKELFDRAAKAAPNDKDIQSAIKKALTEPAKPQEKPQPAKAKGN